ncbi:ABC transporter ATP-binding protein [Paenibacillus sp. CMAA1364]
MTKLKSRDNDNPNEVVLSVEHVSKKIGKHMIIKDISFEVTAGEIFGFLGPNGAGKTTTIRMLVDLIKPTRGQIKVYGYDVNRDQENALRYVGSIVENPEVYTYLSGWENLEHFARMQKGIDAKRIHEVVAIVNLDKRIHDKVRTYSLGMRQRLGIAQALLGRPKLLILDEPTNGLDPKGIKELREFIRQLAADGMGVFVSSHLLSEIQLLCDRVAIISQGSVLAIGEVNELVSANAGYVIWDVEPIFEGRNMLLACEGVQVLDATEYILADTIIAGMTANSVVTQMDEESVSSMVTQLVNAGIAVKGVHQINPTLEQLFLQMTAGDNIE